MQKRVFIVHRWDGSPQKDWLPWAKHECEKKGFEVVVPSMPEPAVPKIEAWVSFLKDCVGAVDEQTCFIGHSIGCQTIMRYLETIYPQKIGGVIFVAGWFNLINLEDEEVEKIAKPWLEKPIDYEKVKNATNNVTVLLSDNDPFVPLTDKKLFEERLHAHVIVEKKKGHYTKRDGTVELPSLMFAMEHHIDIFNQKKYE